MVSSTEENYLKALLHLTVEESSQGAGTNDLAAYLHVKPATANDMIKKLKEKGLVHYEKYKKVTLTEAGKEKAIEILRKHRLWETFLYEKLEFTWDEVHEVAEQLEHIQSPKLIEKLDKLLGYPEYDPHGDAIPDARGGMKTTSKKKLSDILPGNSCRIVAVKDNSAAFLQYVTQLGIGIDLHIKVLRKRAFDGSMDIEVNQKVASVSKKFADNILVV